MNYYAFEQNRTAGPYSLEELRAKLERGELTATDQVCPQGTEAWQPLARVLELGTASAQNLPPLIPPLPLRPKRRIGCGGCLLIGLVVVAVLAIGIIGTSYYILFHTALPFRFAETALSGPNFAIKGISGSMASGFSIESVRWRAENGDTGEAENIKFQYSGFFDFAQRHELIIKELSVGKANLIVTSSSAETSTTTSTAQAPSTPVTGQTSSNEINLKLFRIDLIHFGNVHVKDSRTGFEMTMPEFDYSGFKWQPDSIDLGNLRISSDRLDVVTRPGRTVKIDGKTVGFQKFVEGTIKPLLHRSVKQPIDFALDVGVSESKALFFRLTAIEGKLEVYADASKEGYCRVRDLPLADYLAIPPYDLPVRLTLDARLTERPGLSPDKQKILTGNFTLGVTDFEIQPEATVIDEKAGNVHYDFRAAHKTADGEIDVSLQFESTDSRIQPSFSSTPALSAAELLSQVFYGKPYSDLAPAEKKQTDDRIPVYFPETAAAAVEK